MSQTPRAKDVLKSPVKQKGICFTMVKPVPAKPSQNGAGTKDSLVCLIGNNDSNDSFIHQSIINLFQGTHQLIHNGFSLWIIHSKQMPLIILVSQSLPLQIAICM